MLDTYLRHAVKLVYQRLRHSAARIASTVFVEYTFNMLVSDARLACSPGTTLVGAGALWGSSSAQGYERASGDVGYLRRCRQHGA